MVLMITVIHLFFRYRFSLYDKDLVEIVVCFKIQQQQFQQE